MPASSRTLLAVLSCLLAATLWGTFWFPLREFRSMGLPGLWTTLTIYIGALLALLPWFWGRRIGLRRQLAGHPVNLIVIAAAAGWTNLAFILAVLDGTVVRVLLLFYMAPMWTVLFGWLILREHPDRAGVLTLLLAMAGGVIMLWPQQGDVLTTAVSYADGLALSAGMAFALNNVMVRRSGYLPIGFKMLAAWTGVLILTIVGDPADRQRLAAAGHAGWLAACRVRPAGHDTDDLHGPVWCHPPAGIPFGGDLSVRDRRRRRVGLAAEQRDHSLARMARRGTGHCRGLAICARRTPARGCLIPLSAGFCHSERM
ncbi:MAG: DMT family transporter [Gammaproteobacteria bacterium]|nr:DMT family transporter [Gammaproteobacteria bacterium]